MRKSFNKIALAVAALTGLTSAANAFVILTITDGVTTVSCDSSVGGCAPEFGVFALGANSLSFTDTSFGSIGGGYDISVSTTTGNQPGTAILGRLSNTVDGIINNTGALGILTITADGFGYTAPVGNVKALFGRGAYTIAQNATGADSVTGTYSAGNNAAGPFNALPAATTTCTVALTTTASTPCDTGTINFTDPDGGFYSLRDQQMFTLASGSNLGATTSVNVNRVPEPTTSALIGVALLALGASTRRRKAKQA